MTLTAHAVVGVAAASLFPSHPKAAFAAAFVSHFLIDAIPHWHYSVKSIEIDHKDPMNTDMVFNKYFPTDLTKIGFDAALGFFTAYLIFHDHLNFPLGLILIGTIGGILPDPLQFVYWKFRCEPFITLQRFHKWIHADKNLDNRPVWGILAQAATIPAAILLVRFI